MPVTDTKIEDVINVINVNNVIDDISNWLKTSEINVIFLYAILCVVCGLLMVIIVGSFKHD